MKKLLAAIPLLALALIGCTPSSSSSIPSSSLEESSSPIESESSSEPVYENVDYQNPLRFHKQDGSEYFLTCADPDVIYGDDGYWYMYCTNTYCEMGDKGVAYDRGPIFRSQNLIDWTWVGSVFDGHSDALEWGDPDAGVWAPSVLKVGDTYNYYYSLSPEIINELKNFEKLDIDIVFNVSNIKNVNVLGFDYYSLNGIKVNSLTITSDIERDFNLLSGALKDTGLTKIYTSNVNINNLSGTEVAYEVV